MTVNSRCALLFLVLFIDSVCSVQNLFQSHSAPPFCSHPYSCMPTSQCAERHSVQGTDEVLFQCEGKQTVCCPPVRSSFPPAQNVRDTTTERGAVGSCNQCSRETNKPQSVPVGDNPAKEPGVNTPQGQAQTSSVMGHLPESGATHHIHPSSVGERPVPPQPADSRRPPQVQPADSRRPPQVQPADSRRPPQVQPAEGRRPPEPYTQPPSSQFPQSSLSSHRNFRLLPSESKCGVNNFANRITEGEEVSLGEYPWMVLTGLRDKFGNYRWNCGGTLINEWYVLTAAHCIIVDNRNIEYVRLGEHSLVNETDCCRDVCLDPPEDIAIAEVIPHERWNTTTIKNDIALLRLSRNPLKLGKSNIYPICLPLDKEKLNLTSNTKYEVAGWGKTDWNADEGSDVLRKASISGVNREECNICKDKKKQQYCPIADTQLCVQGWKSVDVCKGDSGGPLMVTRLNVYQIGITSFKGSEYCGAENIPSIFTKIDSYLPWILDNIRE